MSASLFFISIALDLYFSLRTCTLRLLVTTAVTFLTKLGSCYSFFPVFVCFCFFLIVHAPLYVLHVGTQVLEESRRGCWIPWNWSYRQLIVSCQTGCWELNSVLYKNSKHAQWLGSLSSLSSYPFLTKHFRFF